MAAPIPDLTPLGQIDETDILEFVHGEVSPRTDRFSVTRADLDMQYKVPGDKLIGFLMWMLGVDYVSQEGSTYSLRRTCPAFHPVHCWAWCNSVSVQGQGFDGDDTSVLQYEFQNTPAAWEQYVCTATYEMPPYNVLYDGTVDTEYERFVSKELVPTTELVSIEFGGELKYDANAADAWNGKPVYTIKQLARRETAGLKVKWWRVPQVWVQEDDDSLPLKLLQIQGRVNDAEFLGREAETLLCKNVTFEKYVSPLTTNNVGTPYFMYDITFDFIWYDPLPKGKSGETRHGWNFYVGGQDLKYYYGATDAGLKNFQTFTFSKAFTHYSDTWTPP